MKTQHIQSGLFHFFRMELLVPAIIVTFVALIFIVPEVLSDDFKFYIIIEPIMFCALCSYSILFAFLRARFLRRGGYCTITPDAIKATCNGKTTLYEYKGRSITTRHHKDGTKDIYIGRNPMHLLEFGFGRKYFSTLLACLGLGAPLYNVVNADEALEYIKQYN